MFSKKIFLSTLVCILCITSFSFIVSANDKGMEKTSLDVLTDSQNLEVLKVTDDKVEVVEVNSSTKSLPDGKYIINKGTGWVLADDASLLKTAFANDMGSTTIKVSDKVSSSKTSTISGGMEVSFMKFKTGFKIAYGREFIETRSLSTLYKSSAPEGKEKYLKLYSTYNRYDYIEVRNGQIIGQTISYEPEGVWLKEHIYNSGDIVDQDSLEESIDRCVIGDSTISTSPAS